MKYLIMEDCTIVAVVVIRSFIDSSSASVLVKLIGKQQVTQLTFLIILLALQ